jgi:hypothetical protein
MKLFSINHSLKKNRRGPSLQKCEELLEHGINLRLAYYVKCGFHINRGVNY